MTMMTGDDCEPLAYDSNFRGPLWRRRSCTDVPCLVIFLLFLGGWLLIAQYAIRNVDHNNLMIPSDSANHKCGLDSEVLDKKYLFFFNLEKCIDPLMPITSCPTPQVCVKTCPTQTFVWDTMKNRLSLEELKERLICMTEKDRRNINSKEDAELAINSNRCARWYIKSAPFLNKCMWDLSPEVCDYIPSSLQQRNRSHVLDAFFNQSLSGQMEPQLQAMALALSTSDRRIAGPDSKEELMEDPIVQCRRRTQLDETVIKEKIIKTDTKLAKLIGNLVAHYFNGTHSAQRFGEEIAEDILNSWHVILVASVCTLVASLILIALMRWLAAPFVWLSILCVHVGLIVGIYICIKAHIYYNQIALESNLEDNNTFLVASIFLGISFIVILISVIFMRKRIKIAIALIREGSKAVSSVKSTVFFPIFSWTLFIAVIVFGVAIDLYLGSVGEPAFRMARQLDPEDQINALLEELQTLEHGYVPMKDCVCEGPAQNYTVGAACEPSIFHDNCYNPAVSSGDSFNELTREPCTLASCVFEDLKQPVLINFFMVYNTFGFFWLLFFIAAFSEMVLAAVFATWYWTFKKRDVPFFTLPRAFGQTVFYHLGTLALGSLIITICRMIRIMLDLVNQHLKKSHNAVARVILYCMRHLFSLLESFLRFINRNVYIMCAIHGKNFCGSAQDAFNLLTRNILNVVTVNNVTDFLLLLCKVVVTGAVSGSTYCFLTTDPPNIQLNYIAVPLIIVVVITFLMTSVFFSVYSMAVDTLFLCFLEDCERNDGSPEKPFYMSKELMEILDKRSKVPDRLSLEQFSA